MSQPAFANAVGWSLVVAASLAFAIATAGFVYGLIRDDERSVTEFTPDTDTDLHSTYYVVRNARAAVWPLLLCMALSSAVGIIGYMQTDHFIKRSIGEVVNRQR